MAATVLYSSQLRMLTHPGMNHLHLEAAGSSSRCRRSFRSPGRPVCRPSTCARSPAALLWGGRLQAELGCTRLAGPFGSWDLCGCNLCLPVSVLPGRWKHCAACGSKCCRCNGSCVALCWGPHVAELLLQAVCCKQAAFLNASSKASVVGSCQGLRGGKQADSNMEASHAKHCSSLPCTFARFDKGSSTAGGTK